MGGHPTCPAAHIDGGSSTLLMMWTIPFDAGTFAVTTFALLT